MLAPGVGMIRAWVRERDEKREWSDAQGLSDVREQNARWEPGEAQVQAAVRVQDEAPALDEVPAPDEAQEQDAVAEQHGHRSSAPLRSQSVSQEHGATGLASECGGAIATLRFAQACRGRAHGHPGPVHGCPDLPRAPLDHGRKSPSPGAETDMAASKAQAFHPDNADDT
jgi:hypothetical protein